MRKILMLFKLQMDNKSDLLKTVNPKVMVPALLKSVVLILLATLAVSFGLSKVFVLGFAINQELIGLVLLLTQLVSLIFATGNVINTLYLSRDNQMLMCLPATPNQLFISKILLIYVNEFAVNLSMAVPLFLVLGSFSNFGWSYYVSLIPLLVLMPVLPIVAAAFLSIPIMAIIKFLKKHTVIAIVVTFSLIAAVLWVYRYS